MLVHLNIKFDQHVCDESNKSIWIEHLWMNQQTSWNHSIYKLKWVCQHSNKTVDWIAIHVDTCLDNINAIKT